MKLKGKFLLLFALGTAGSMLAIALVGYFFMKEQTVMATHTKIAAVLDVHSSKMDGWLKSKTRILETTGIMIRNTITDEEINATHLQVYRLDPDINNIYFGLVDGRFFDGADWPTPLGYDPRQQNWYQQAAEKVGITVTAPYTGKITNRQVVSFVMPIRGQLGQLRGVLGAEVQLTILSDFIKNVNLNGNGYGVLIDKNGLIIAHPDADLLNTHLHKDPNLGKLTQKLLATEEGIDTFVAADIEYVVMYRKVPATGWTMAIVVAETAVNQTLTTMKQRFAITTILVMLLVIAITLLLSRHFIRPMVELAAKALRVASGDLSMMANLQETDRQDELGQLTTSFNEMLSNVSQREVERLQQIECGSQEVIAANQQLQAMNEELSNTLNQLQKAQMQMIQSEKMAALGNLVAGMAHEINTPVGIGVTASSHLAQITEEFFRCYEKGNLTRENLLDYITDTREAAKIVLTNLERAASLTRSLKQVSADQASEKKRVFNVKNYINEVLLSLQPKLKKTKHGVIIHCEETLEINALSGAISQIITNLIMNSLLHAYDHDDVGEMTIEFVKNENQLVLIYSDDGKGMDTITRSKIFDPFFTTARNTGGTGLGLYILYNIVSQQLGGTIECKSELGKGATFTIQFPL